MLISLSIKNFRSFGEEATFDLMAQSRISSHANHLIPLPGLGSVLRCSILYGANSAGKSNFVHAFRYIQNSVKERSVKTVESFRFDDQFASHPSEFQIRFALDGFVFSYEFSVKGEIVVEEYLLYANKNEEFSLIFERDKAGKVKYNKKVDTKTLNDSALKMLLSNLSSIPMEPNQLFLSRVNSIPLSARGKTLRAVTDWVVNKLVICSPTYKDYRLLQEFKDDPSFLHFCGACLSAFGTGIAELELRTYRKPAEKNELQFIQAKADLIKQAPEFESMSIWPEYSNADIDKEAPDMLEMTSLYAKHTNPQGTSLPFSLESDGTKQLLNFLPILFLAKRKSSTVVIDELDRSIHPINCWELISMFLGASSNRPSQLIGTTHEVHLLDQDLLRKDAYWFMEKDDKLQSRPVPLAEFKVRSDLQIGKGYMQGRFGAIPSIGNKQALLKLLACDSAVEGNFATED